MSVTQSNYNVQHDGKTYQVTILEPGGRVDRIRAVWDDPVSRRPKIRSCIVACWKSPQANRR